MEPNPLYQGTSYSSVRSGSFTPSSTNIMFADKFVQGMKERVKSLQRLEEALIERHDDTIMRNQSAMEKEAAIALNAELQQRLQLENGAPDSFYDADGRIIKSAVNEFQNKYLLQARKWNKGILTPDNMEKSDKSSVDFQTGVIKAVQASILANTKTRQKQAYERNYRLAGDMQDYDGQQRIAEEGNVAGVFDDAQTAMLTRDAQEAQWLQRIDSFTEEEAIDNWDDPSFQESIADFPKAGKALQDRIARLNKIKGTPASFTLQKTKDGEKKVTKEPVRPPKGAALYVQSHWLKYEGDFSSPEAKTNGFTVLQRHLAEEVTLPQGSTEGDKQWQDARALATSIGLSAGEFEQAYETRLKQITYGGFDASKVIGAISDDDWLATTKLDEQLPEDMDANERKNKLKIIISRLRSEMLSEYNKWYSDNEAKNPTSRDCAARVQQLFRSRQVWDANLFNDVMDELGMDADRQSRRVSKELIATADRKRKSEEARQGWETVAPFVRKALSPLKNYTAGKGIFDKTEKVSTDISFNYELGQSRNATKLPDSKTRDIIYLPKGMKPPAKKVNVLMNNGKHGLQIEFRNANVSKPTMSVSLRQSTNMLLRTPASIRWDGANLTFSNADAEEEAYEEAMPVSTTGLFPEDDGLVPTNDDFMPEESLPIP